MQGSCLIAAKGTKEHDPRPSSACSGVWCSSSSYKVRLVQLMAGSWMMLMKRTWKAVIHLECGQYLLDKDVANAKTYCESFITELEEYKEERGVYPPRLSLPVDDDREKPDQRPREVPWMLQDSVQAKDQNQASRTAQFYKVADDGRSFQFFFDDPSAIGGVQYVFNSSASDWTLETTTANHPRP